MANKKFKQNFAVNFGGVDGLSSVIEDDEGKVNLADNFEYAASNSLRGTTGYQHAALSAGMIAVFPYTYSRVTDQYDVRYQTASGVYPNQTGDIGSTKTTADGATIQKVIGINSQAWSLENLTIPVTRVSGTYPFTWYNAPGLSASLLPTFRFKLFANGVQLLDQDVGTHTAPTTIYSLLGAIDALAELSINRFDRAVCPPCAVVNATGPTTFVAATPYGQSYSVTVLNSPHSFKIGDVITFPKYGQLIAGIVIATTATTITYIGRQVDVVTGDILGYLGQDASAFPVQDTSIASSGNLNVIFPYWKAILDGDSSRIRTGSTTEDYGGSFYWNQQLFLNKSLGSFYAPMTSANAQGNLFIAGSVNTPTGIESNQGSYAGALIKIDGQQVTRAGIRDPSFSLATSGAGVLTGNYKYRALLRRVDSQGNIIDGSPVQREITAAANSIGVTVGCGTYADASGFLVRGCLKAIANESTAGFFYVDNAGGGVPTIQVGDPVAFFDNANVLRRSVVTDYCATAATISPSGPSIKIADTTRTINDNAVISAGLTVVFLRTLAGGNQFYEIHEAPITGLGTYTYVDNVADSTVSALPTYALPVIGKERNAPPPCSLVCQHQGGLVVARGRTVPNTVSFSTVDGIEFFPLASNSFDIPSTQDGYITAIASDTNDRLAVFKRRAYYDVVGDLDAGNFSINIKHEGDYGITSQASLARIKDSLIGLSDNGFVVIKDGELLANVFNDVNANLVNRPTAAFEWAVAANDAYSRRYSCSILPVLTRNETIHYALDYSRGNMVAFSRRENDFTDAAGGMVSIGKDFYHLSIASNTVFKRLSRFTPTTTTGYPARTAGDFYYQDAVAGRFSFESNVINLGQPDVLNTPIRLRIWSVPNDFSMDEWLPFTMKVYARAGTTSFGNIGIPTGADTEVSVTFAQPGFIDVKLAQNKKTHFYIVRFEGRLEKQAPFITGYEILYAENYKAEDLVK
jgi:hypothetical protein